MTGLVEGHHSHGDPTLYTVHHTAQEVSSLSPKV